MVKKIAKIYTFLLSSCRLEVSISPEGQRPVISIKGFLVFRRICEVAKSDCSFVISVCLSLSNRLSARTEKLGPNG